MNVEAQKAAEHAADHATSKDGMQHAVPGAPVDLTPSWRVLMPGLIAALVDGTAEGKRLAEAELNRVAGSLDSVAVTLAQIKRYDAAMNAEERMPTGEDYNTVVRLLGVYA